MIETIVKFLVMVEYVLRVDNRKVITSAYKYR